MYCMLEYRWGGFDRRRSSINNGRNESAEVSLFTRWDCRINPVINRRCTKTYQIELYEEDANALKKRAEKLGVPYMELLRSSVREIAQLSDEQTKALILESVRRHEQALKRLAWSCIPISVKLFQYIFPQKIFGYSWLDSAILKKSEIILKLREQKGHSFCWVYCRRK